MLICNGWPVKVFLEKKSDLRDATLIKVKEVYAYLGTCIPGRDNSKYKGPRMSIHLTS